MPLVARTGARPPTQFMKSTAVEVDLKRSLPAETPKAGGGGGGEVQVRNAVQGDCPSGGGGDCWCR